MANLVELEFPALDVSGENYFMWASNVECYLAAEGLQGTIEEGKSASLQDRAKAMVFICRHLDEDLRFQYITWDKPGDRVALFGLGFASVVALWASLNLVTAIDKLPVVPGVFELIGIWFSTWFIYRYLLFKPDRKELVQIINKSLADVIGQ